MVEPLHVRSAPTSIKTVRAPTISTSCFLLRPSSDFLLPQLLDSDVVQRKENTLKKDQISFSFLRF